MKSLQSPPYFSMIFILITFLIDPIESDCCGDYTLSGCIVNQPEQKLVSMCMDCTQATPYCGLGKCDFLGCNCDGGCRMKKDNVNITILQTRPMPLWLQSLIDTNEREKLVDYDYEIKIEA